MRASYGLSPGLISTPERSSNLFPASAKGSAEEAAIADFDGWPARRVRQQRSSMPAFNVSSSRKEEPPSGVWEENCNLEQRKKKWTALWLSLPPSYTSWRAPFLQLKSHPARPTGWMRWSPTSHIQLPLLPQQPQHSKAVSATTRLGMPELQPHAHAQPQPQPQPRRSKTC